MANDIVGLGLLVAAGFLVIIAGFAFLGLLVTIILHFARKKKVDNLAVLFKEQLELCKVNRNMNLRWLFLVPVPSMFDFVDLVEEFKAGIKEKQYDVLVKLCGELITVLNVLISRYTSAASISKGKIIGSNVLDRQATISELMTNKANERGEIVVEASDGTKEVFSSQEIEDLRESVEKNGPFLYALAYEREMGRKLIFFADIKPFIALAYHNQVLFPGAHKEIDINVAAGDVSLLAPGTTRYGQFEFLTGYPGNLKIMATEIKLLTWGMQNRQLIGNVANITQDAMDLNVGFTQGMAYEEAKRAITQPKRDI